MKETLPKRKKIRLKGYDYSKTGSYFITICTKNRECILSKIKNGNNKYTLEGKIVNDKIKQMKIKYPYSDVDEYVIMPNHIHMILKINNNGKKSISKIIQQLKGIITKEIGYNIWQKSFYEHIIRNKQEYLLIKKYIIRNPDNWNEEKYN